MSVSKFASRVSSVVQAFVDGSTSIDAANTQLIASKSNMLTSIAKVLTRCDPVDGDVWTKEWHEPALKALIASGRYTVDGKGRSLSASAACSNLKIAVIALTNDEVPTAEDTSLKNFVQRVRPGLAADGLIEETSKGAKKKTEQTRSTKRAQELQAAFMLAAGKDKHRANLLAAIMTSHVEAFDDWADEFFVQLDAAITSKRRGTGARR